MLMPWRRLIMHLVFGATAAVIVELALAPAMISLAGTPVGVTRCGNDLVTAYLLLAATAFVYYRAARVTRSHTREDPICSKPPRDDRFELS